MFRLGNAVFFILLFLSAACSSTVPLIAEPTQKLIVPTVTDTPIPQTPTLTFTPLPRANDLSTATPLLPEQATSTAAIPTLNDAVAGELVGLAQRRVAEVANLPVRRVQVVEVKSYKWTDTSLGCPSSNETYAQHEVDGYRIVLSANDQLFIFHTDFDRVVTCDPANEKLPTSPSD